MAAPKNPNRTLPFAQWEEVDVTFPAVAGTDIEVPHTLSPDNPEQIYYFVARADRAVRVYHDTSATRKPWQTSYILLRADVANAKATLLLWTSHTVRQLPF